MQRWRPAAAAEVAVWTVLCFGVWMATVSTASGAELVAAAVAAVLSGLAAAHGRRATGGRWRPAAAWLRWPVVVAAAVVADSGRVLLAAVGPHRPRGRTDAVALPVEEGPRGQARLALGGAAVGACPASVVLEEHRHRIALHRLGGGRPDPGRAVRR